MSYGDFKTVAEVAEKFDIELKTESFIDELAIEIPDYPFSDLERRLGNEMSFINEVAICEDIIKPILNLIEIHYESVHIWTHVTYNVDKDKGLVGEPDYLIAPRTKYGRMGIPPLCVIEAKQEKFEEGWAQALAEMVAASIQDDQQIFEAFYAVVTTGKYWEFGQLKKSVFTKDRKQISATMDLQRVFDTLNWIFFVIDHKIKNTESLKTA
jgi:hypothetical protein